MEYKNRRFAQDPRFRFFVLDTVQRHLAIKRKEYLLNRQILMVIFKNYVMQCQKTKIVKGLYYWCSNVRGTNSYWFKRRVELESMISQLDIVPTAFLTLSAVDLWWSNLTRLRGCNLEEEELLNGFQIVQQLQKLVNKNPLIAENYFMFRADTSIGKVVFKQYKVLDCWFRFEFQHRAVHTVLFGTPDPPDSRKNVLR